MDIIKFVNDNMKRKSGDYNSVMFARLQKWLEKNHYHVLQYINDSVTLFIPLIEKLYILYNNCDIGKCKECGKNTPFLTFRKVIENFVLENVCQNLL